MRRVHGPYAQYYNARAARTGHLWQNRFFGCMLASSHPWSALTFVERNPLRARMVRRAEDFVWSKAIAHVTGGDGSGILDMDWWREWRRKGSHDDWREVLNRPTPKAESPADDLVVRLRACTYADVPSATRRLSMKCRGALDATRIAAGPTDGLGSAFANVRRNSAYLARPILQVKTRLRKSSS